MKLPKLKRNRAKNPTSASGGDESQTAAVLADAHESTSDSPDAEDQDLSLEWTGPASKLTKAFSGLLLVCLASGVVALLMASYLVMGSGQTAPDRSAADVDGQALDERSAVGAFAQDYVVTWLTSSYGQEEQLDPFLSDTDQVTLPEQPWVASNTAVAGISQTGPHPGDADKGAGEWTVTVAVDLIEQESAPPQRRYFQVPVLYDDQALVATALPAPVARPTTAATPQLGYSGEIANSDPIGSATQEFLTALLVADGGDVTRYTTPGAGIRSIAPAPYTSVSIEEIRSDEDLTGVNQGRPENGTEVKVLVTATGTAASNREIGIQYALTMTARESRWEVTEIDPSPLLRTEDPATSPATGTEPAEEETEPTAPEDDEVSGD